MKDDEEFWVLRNLWNSLEAILFLLCAINILLRMICCLAEGIDNSFMNP